MWSQCSFVSLLWVLFHVCHLCVMTGLLVFFTIMHYNFFTLVITLIVQITWWRFTWAENIFHRDHCIHLWYTVFKGWAVHVKSWLHESKGFYVLIYISHVYYVCDLHVFLSFILLWPLIDAFLSCSSCGTLIWILHQLQHTRFMNTCALR